MNHIKDVEHICADPVLPDIDQEVPHIKRGVMINGILDGQGTFNTSDCFNECPLDGDTEKIDFDPEHASRLDKFDGLEYATERMDKELEKRHNDPASHSNG